MLRRDIAIGLLASARATHGLSSYGGLMFFSTLKKHIIQSRRAFPLTLKPA